MSDWTHPDWIEDEPYWEQELEVARDEWDQHVRAVELEERDRTTRDDGENNRREGRS